MKLNKKVENVRVIAEDILGTDFLDETELEKLVNKFYELMTKHGICEGSKTVTGRLCNNPEWTICQDLFFNRIQSQINMILLLGDHIPAELMIYED